MVKVYIADIRNLKDPKIHPELLNELPEERKKEILQYKNSNDRIQNLGIDLLQKEALNRYREVYKDESEEKLNLCISQAENMVICAVSEKEVGCAINKTAKNRKGLSRQLFSQNERKYLESFQEERAQEVCRLWTFKESYMKFAKEKSEQPSKLFEIRIGSEIQVYRGGVLQECMLEEYYVPGYKVSVCTKEEEFAPEATFVNLI